MSDTITFVSFSFEHINNLGGLLVCHKNAVENQNGSIGPKTKEKLFLNIARGDNYPTYILEVA